MTRPLTQSDMLTQWGVPPEQELLKHLRQLAKSHVAAECAVSAIQGGEFTTPSAQTESLGEVRNPVPQVALLAWLATHCKTKLSVEVGFGMGMTAAVILAARSRAKREFDHRIFDPYGLPDNRGALAQAFLSAQFGSSFQRIKKRSQLGMAELSADGSTKTELIMIDGDHRVDAVFADFYAADQLLAVGGMMVLDDAWFPAVETIVQFVRHNREDYEVSHLELANTAVLRKISNDPRNWDHFRPFPVPQRADWTPINQE